MIKKPCKCLQDPLPTSTSKRVKARAKMRLFVNPIVQHRCETYTSKHATGMREGARSLYTEALPDWMEALVTISCHVMSCIQSQMAQPASCCPEKHCYGHLMQGHVSGVHFQLTAFVLNLS